MSISTNETSCFQVQLKSAGIRRFDQVIGADGCIRPFEGSRSGRKNQFEKSLGYAVAALEVPGYRPRDEDMYLMYGMPRRMLRQIHGTRQPDAVLVFVHHRRRGPTAAIGQQRAVLRDSYRDGKWETPRILGRLEGAQTNFTSIRVSQIRIEPLVERA